VPGDDDQEFLSGCPEFIQAVEQLQRFLEAQCGLADIAWVFRDDFYWCTDRRPIVRWPLPKTNEVLAQRYFEVGRRLGRGVGLVAVCRHAARALCYVCFPRNDAEAQYSLITGLKLSILEPFPAAHVEVRSLSWLVRRILPAYRHHQACERFVPNRRMVVACETATAVT
jgi:hypothetical protein